MEQTQTFIRVMKVGYHYNVNICYYIGTNLHIVETCYISKKEKEARQQAVKFAEWRKLEIC